jgi:F0F1-type ATP synthase membrane subunit b/b'
MDIKISDKLIETEVEKAIKELYSNSPELLDKIKEKKFKNTVKKTIEKYIADNFEDICFTIIDEMLD